MIGTLAPLAVEQSTRLQPVSVPRSFAETSMPSRTIELLVRQITRQRRSVLISPVRCEFCRKWSFKVCNAVVDLDQDFGLPQGGMTKSGEDCSISMRHRRAGERVMAIEIAQPLPKLMLFVNRVDCTVVGSSKCVLFRLYISTRWRSHSPIASRVVERSKKKFCEFTCLNQSVNLEQRVQGRLSYPQGGRSCHRPSGARCVLQNWDSWFLHGESTLLRQRSQRARKKFAEPPERSLPLNVAV